MENRQNWPSFLLCNHRDPESFYSTLHFTFRLFILEQICDTMNQMPTVRQQILSAYRSYPDNIWVAHHIAQALCGVEMPKEDCIWLDQCLHAYFNKGSRRIPVPLEKKNQLLAAQHYRCAYCHSSIGLEAHCDHIVPWVYVGDELSNNYQMLCPLCNEKKHRHAYYPLKAQLLKPVQKGVLPTI